MYRWWVFVHIVGVFGFLTAHGASVAVAFRLRGERNPARIQALLELSGRSINAFFVSLLVLLTGGIVAGFLGHWWAQAWIWVSLGVLVATSLVMFLLGTPYYKRLRLAAQEASGGSEVVTEDRLVGVLRSPVPIILAFVGFGALGLILYLMMFKPF
ncbi:MAG: DUF2269 family protein [Actinomycetota bacterium]